MAFTNNLFDLGLWGFDQKLGAEIINYDVSGNGFYFPDDQGVQDWWAQVGRFDMSFPGNFMASTIDDVRFTDHANHDYTLANNSPFKGILGGNDPGVDYSELNAALLGVV